MRVYLYRWVGARRNETNRYLRLKRMKRNKYHEGMGLELDSNNVDCIILLGIKAAM